MLTLEPMLLEGSDLWSGKIKGNREEGLGSPETEGGIIMHSCGCILLRAKSELFCCTAKICTLRKAVVLKHKLQWSLKANFLSHCWDVTCTDNSINCKFKVKSVAGTTTSHHSYSEIAFAFQAMPEHGHDHSQYKCITLVKEITVRDIAMYYINALTL